MEKNLCGVSTTIKIIGRKWTILILHQLCAGTKRFGELQRALPGISPKTLSERLKELEDDGIVNKKIFNEIPLHVEYTLTKKGLSLKDIINQMEKWGEKKVKTL
ncbi:helix-turn-helix domain-containing protein [soil metagenome]